MNQPVAHKRDGDGGPTAVLVHGTMDTRASFRLVAEHLSKWTTISYDRRGWGDSGDTGDTAPTLSDHVADLAAILADAPGSVVAGHSYGGYVALCTAAAHPDLVRAVVAYEPPIPWLPWWPELAPWERVVREAAKESPQAAARAMLKEVIGRVPPTMSEERLAADGAMLINEMSDPGLDTPQFDPVELPTPATLSAGERSLPHHIEVSKYFALLAPQGRYTEIPGAEHTAHVTHAKQFSALITSAVEAD